MRSALTGLERFIVICRTAKYFVFQSLPPTVLVESKIVAIAIQDSFHLGVLSSRAHIVWALAAGSRLEDRPTYNNTLCFDPFPFPNPDEVVKERVRELGEQLDSHRKRQQALHPDLTITGMYNVLEKLCSGEPLTAKDKKIHEDGLVSVLKQIHDDLDAAVFDAYGWSHDLTDEQILEHLVALNAERAEEECRGIIRWMRPEFQNPAGAVAPTQTTMISTQEKAETAGESRAVTEWPKELPRQIAAVRDLVSANGGSSTIWSVDAAARAFRGAKKKELESVLESLAALGIVIAFDTPEGRRWRAARD